MLIMILCFYVHITKMLNKYNDILIYKIFQLDETINVTMETNVASIENVKEWLNI